MFKYCVWYLLNDTHLINNRIIHNSKILKTSPFLGHITIKHTLDRKQAEDVFDEYSKKEKPFFLRFGQLKSCSTNIGNNVSIGGQSGISGHLKIGNNVKIGGGSGVVNDIADGMIVMGYPAVPLKQFLKREKKND